MKLKDIFELKDYGFDENSKVEIFDMDKFDEAMDEDLFDEVYTPEYEEAYIYKYGFVIDGKTLVIMKE